MADLGRSSRLFSFLPSSGVDLQPQKRLLTEKKKKRQSRSDKSLFQPLHLDGAYCRSRQLEAEQFTTGGGGGGGGVTSSVLFSEWRRVLEESCCRKQTGRERERLTCPLRVCICPSTDASCCQRQGSCPQTGCSVPCVVDP